MYEVIGKGGEGNWGLNLKKNSRAEKIWERLMTFTVLLYIFILNEIQRLTYFKIL